MDHGDGRRHRAGSLENVLITERISTRPARPADHESESRALGELARTLAEEPRSLLGKLAELILDLCRAESSGVSILTHGRGEGFFRWPAVAGVWREYTGRGLPLGASPCGVVIRQDRPLLFDRPSRIFDDLAAVDPPIAEGLLVPFHIRGAPVGTVWAIHHTPGLDFDAEDLRLLQSLSRFAAAGHQALEALDAAEAGRADLRRRVEDQTRELRASEERLRQILASATDFAILTQALDRTVTSWSPGAEVVFGYKADEIVGRSGDVLFTPEDREAGAPRAEAETARRDGRASDERWHLRKGGGRFYALGVMNLLRDGEGFVKVLRDLTDRKRMEDELRRARDDLELRVAERTADLRTEIERRRDLTRQLSTAQEDERRRISRDLHDSIGQLLAGLSLAFQAVEVTGELTPPTADKLAEAKRLAEALGKETHALAVRLRPTSLDDLGLESALGQLVGDWSGRAGVRADFQAAGLGRRRLGREIETALYRVIQEALTNVARHASASIVSVVVSQAGRHVTAVIEDDGRGFDAAAVPRGRIGIVGMRERVEQVGGELVVESQPGEGATIRIRIELPDGEGGEA